VLLIEKLQASAKFQHTTEGSEDDSTLWGQVCQYLGIGNVHLNRKRLKKAFNRHKKVTGFTNTIDIFINIC